MRRIVLRVLGTFAAAIFGFCGGCNGFAAIDHPHAARAKATYYPLPHSVPKDSDGVALHFAMVHDVLHERFPKHGSDHYRERNRLSREMLAKLDPDSPSRDARIDDLSVGLARLGEFDEAIRLQREKLKKQKAAGVRDRELYPTYANLGTFLMIANIKGMYAGDKGATERFRESVELVKESVLLYPASHFRREKWQVVFGEFLLAAAGKPELLRTFDFLGNRLDLKADAALDHEATRNKSSTEGRYGRAYLYEYGSDISGSDRWDRESGSDSKVRRRPNRDDRKFITTVGAEEGWSATPEHNKPVAFDEPVLGIIGMWRQGGGANPHFALALAETMLRVGQRIIAWEAFERTSRLADGYNGDPETNDFLRSHCKSRQTEIEATWRGTSEYRSRGTPRLTDDDIAALRPKFDAELEYGLAFQKAYQDFEAAKIKAGASIEDPRLFDEFFAGREPIASPSGPEELYASAPPYYEDPTQALGAGFLGAGLAVVLANGLRRLIWRRRYPPTAPLG